MDALRPLSLDQFAAMTAEMEAGFPRDRVLEGASVSVEQWELTQETWLLRMAKQGAQRKLALLDRYNELLAKHRKAAQRKMRAEKRKLKGPMPVPAEAHLSPLARVRHDEAGTGATFQRGTPGGDGASRTPQVATAPPAAGPAWISTPAVPPMVAGAPGAAPAILTPPPVIAEASPPTDTLDEDDYDEGTTSIAAAIDPQTAPAGPAWLAGASAPRADAPPVSAAPVSAAPATPFAPAGPAWLASTAPRTDGHRENAAPVGPFAPTGPAWLSGPRPPPAPSSTPAAPPSMPAPAAPAPAGPAWLQSSASSPAVPFQPPAAAAAPPPQPAAAAPPPRPAAPRGSTLSEATTVTSIPGTAPAWLAAAQARKDPPPRPEAAGALPFQRAETHPSAQPAAAAPPAASPQPAPPPRAPTHQPIAATPQTAAQPAPPPRAPTSQPIAATPQAAAQPAPPPRAPTSQPITATPQAAAPAHAAPPQRAPTGPHPATAPQAAAPRLSIEQLAWLQAQMEVSPEAGRAAREHLGLGEADYTNERAFWQARFQQDRATVERYSQLFYHYRRAR